MFDAADLAAETAPAVAAGPAPAAEARVSIGERALHVVLEGPADGRPTVILEAGAFGIAADWAVVQPRCAARLRCLAYDRAGLGRSDPGPEPRDAAAVVDDLQALLAAMNLRGPYVLVAHSLAASHAQLFALRRPEAVVGLVLVDAIPPQAMADRKVAERVKGSEWFAGFAPLAARLGLLRAADPLAGDPIGLPEAAAAAKRAAFRDEAHNHWAAAEAREQLKDGEAARAAGELSRELPVAVIHSVGDAGLREHLEAPARRSRRGYAELVEGANSATILGPRHADAVLRGIDHVARYA